MLSRSALLSDLQRLLQRLEADLLDRSTSAELPDVGQKLRAEYERANKAQRTAQNFEDWRTAWITQHAAAWVLSCVFVRFLEDNRLIDPPRIAGPGERLQRARDEHELYFHEHKKQTDRGYLLHVLDELASYPGAADVFGPRNPLRELPTWLSGDAAGELLRFFQKIDANTGALVHDFTDHEWDTRFLGDLYQDLSEEARKRYALLQTPEFVEEFILDRTLEPALDEFGLEGKDLSAWSLELSKDSAASSLLSSKNQKLSSFKMIDPACGSGHFLLGSFRRILDRWERADPKAKCREVVQRTLDCIFGVDVNPYAVAIARFRLLLAALKACGVMRLRDAPAFQTNLVCGDSLLHGSPGGDQRSLGWTALDHTYQAEDPQALQRILAPGTYHAVVANPPYITPKDRVLNQAYRDNYKRVCHRKYSLAVPFMQRIFSLAIPGGEREELSAWSLELSKDSAAASSLSSKHQNLSTSSGFVGQITANSFMKREFGKKLIEEFLPSIDLTHVIDTSGAYIPGHGTPTVILFGRNRKPVASTLRTVMGIRGEPSTPDDPAQGLVWSAIVRQIDHPGSESEFVSVGDSPHESFHKHPWSIGGGGAAELKEKLDETANATVS